MAAVMPDSLAPHYARLGVLKVLPLALPLRVPAIYLITRRSRHLSPAAVDLQRQLGESGQVPGELSGARPDLSDVAS